MLAISATTERNTVLSSVMNWRFIHNDSPLPQLSHVHQRQNRANNESFRVLFKHESKAIEQIESILLDQGGLKHEAFKISSPRRAMQATTIAGAAFEPPQEIIMQHRQATSTAIKHMKSIHRHKCSNPQSDATFFSVSARAKSPFRFSPRLSAKPGASHMTATHEIKLFMPKVKVKKSVEEIALENEKRHRIRKMALEKQLVNLDISKDYKMFVQDKGHRIPEYLERVEVPLRRPIHLTDYFTHNTERQDCKGNVNGIRTSDRDRVHRSESESSFRTSSRNIFSSK